MVVMAVVTQEPAYVGWVALLSVMIFIAIAYLVLVVAAGGERVAIGSMDDDRTAPEPSRVAASVPDARTIAVAPPDPFAESMAASMRTIAASVVARANVRPGERILDGGTGEVIVVSAALASGLTSLDVDPAVGTLAIGRRLARAARVAGADFAPLEYASGWFNLIIAVHTLHFASDPVGVLAEWRRVTGPGGRLSISVPGPRSAMQMNRFDPIYRRHDAGFQVHLPARSTLAGWAERAGWQEVRVATDPRLVLSLRGPEALRAWIQTRPWSDPDQGLSATELTALEHDLLAVLPVGLGGRLQIPFAALYLTARKA